MASPALSKATATFNTLKTEFNKPPEAADYAKCRALISELKTYFITFGSFLPPQIQAEMGQVAVQTPAVRQGELALIRETFEYAVLLAARELDLHRLAKECHELFLLYDRPEVEVGSERRLMLVGLYLLSLLTVSADTESFKVFLETLSDEDKDSLYVRDVVGLERYLTEGAFHKLLSARNRAPTNEYLPLLNKLVDTVRAEIAKSLAAAYRQISLAAAAEQLMLPSAEAAAEFAAARKWVVDSGVINFATPVSTKAEISHMGHLLASVRAFPQIYSSCVVSWHFTSQMQYAADIERIV